MSKLKIFTQSHTKNLENKVKAGEIDAYLSDEITFKNFDDNEVKETNIECNLELKLPDKENLFDLENSINLYEALKNLNETQASDKRLWTFLTHVTFWEYMRKRWPAEKFESSSNKKTSRERQKIFILSRYFVITPNRRNLLRNGIARLWWYAHLTYDDNQEDPYQFTRVLLSHQDIAQNLLERSLGSNRKILKTLLAYIKTNSNLDRQQIREKIKLINLVAGVKELQILEQEELLEILKK